MTRSASPVDLGLWQSWYSKEKLLIPLDTHVMQEAAILNLFTLSKNGNVPAASFKTDVELTGLMNKVFPGDPCRADYALFGFGVDKTDNKWYSFFMIELTSKQRKSLEKQAHDLSPVVIIGQQGVTETL